MDDWQKDAECRGMDPNLFFPVSHPNVPDPEAVAACQRCEVIVQCHQYAIHYEDVGFWAGLTPAERRKLREAAGIALEPMSPIFHSTAPHGTVSRYKRHRKSGDPPCEPCKDAWTREKLARDHYSGRKC
jgi:WhiB family transcriptional regulator, redox-sensing transcriptional regulator